MRRCGSHPTAGEGTVCPSPDDGEAVQLFSPLPPLREHCAEKGFEARPVVRVDHVAQFVGHHVVREAEAGLHEVGVHGNGPPGGPAAPAARHEAPPQGGSLPPEGLEEGPAPLEALLKDLPGLMGVPGLQRLLHGLGGRVAPRRDEEFPVPQGDGAPCPRCDPQWVAQPEEEVPLPIAVGGGGVGQGPLAEGRDLSGDPLRPPEDYGLHVG